MKKTALLISVITPTVFALQAQNVGIGTTTPTYPLTVVSDASNKGVVQKAGTTELGFYVSTGGNAYVQTWSPNDLYFTTNNGSAKIAISNASGNVGILTTSPSAAFDINGTFRLRGNGAAAGRVLTSDASGNATWQTLATTANIGFAATLTNSLFLVSNVAVDVAGFTEDFDDGNNFNPANGRFTAPSAGVYQFTYNMNFTETGTDTKYLSIVIKRGGGTTLSFSHISPGINSNWSSSYTNTFMLKLDQGDYINLNVTRSATSGNELRGGNFANSTYFQGTKLY